MHELPLLESRIFLLEFLFSHLIVVFISDLIFIAARGRNNAAQCQIYKLCRYTYSKIDFRVLMFLIRYLHITVARVQWTVIYRCNGAASFCHKFTCLYIKC